MSDRRVIGYRLRGGDRTQPARLRGLGHAACLPPLAGLHPLSLDLADLDEVEARFREAQAEAGGFRPLEEAGAGRGPRIVDIQPGDIDTPFNAHLAEQPNAAERRAYVQAKRAACDRACGAGPRPSHVADAIIHAIEACPASPVRSGHWFQTRLGPMALAALPSTLREAVLRRYYWR